MTEVKQDDLRILRGLTRGKRFFDTVSYLSKALLLVFGLITMLFFWVFLALHYKEQYFELSVFMIRLIRGFVLLLILSILLSYISFFVHEIIYKKRLIKEEKEILKKIKNGEEQTTQT